MLPATLQRAAAALWACTRAGRQAAALGRCQQGGHGALGPTENSTVVVRGVRAQHQRVVRGGVLRRRNRCHKMPTCMIFLSDPNTCPIIIQWHTANIAHAHLDAGQGNGTVPSSSFGGSCAHL